MDFKSRFNNRRHCDVKVVVDGSTFYLHRFPLEAASTFFDERFGSDSDSDGDNQPARPARPTVELQEFPGGAPSFESVARYVHIVCWRCCRVVTTTNGLTAPTRQVLLRLRCGAGLREHRTYVCCGEVPWNGHTPRCAGLCLRARWRGAAPTASVFCRQVGEVFRRHGVAVAASCCDGTEGGYQPPVPLRGRHGRRWCVCMSSSTSIGRHLLIVIPAQWDGASTLWPASLRSCQSALCCRLIASRASSVPPGTWVCLRTSWRQACSGSARIASPAVARRSLKPMSLRSRPLSSRRCVSVCLCVCVCVRVCGERQRRIGARARLLGFGAGRRRLSYR